MSNQSLKVAVRERMASTGENYTTARRVLRERRQVSQRRSGLVDTRAVRQVVARTWGRFCDGTGRPALVTDTIPALCDEVDTLRALERAVLGMATDPTVAEATRTRLLDLLAEEPVERVVTLAPLAHDQTELLRVPRRGVPFPGGTSQADFFRVLTDYADALDRVDTTSPVARVTGVTKVTDVAEVNLSEA